MSHPNKGDILYPDLIINHFFFREKMCFVDLEMVTDHVPRRTTGAQLEFQEYGVPGVLLRTIWSPL